MVHPIILAVMMIPMLVSGIVWLAIAWLSWDAWSPRIHTLVMEWTPESWASGWEAAWLGTGAAFAAAALALIPLILVTSAVIAALFAMPVLLKHVAERGFPTLERRRGGTIGGSAWNALAAIGTFLVLWIVTLPLWLIAPLALVVPLLLSAHLNQRLFRYDALSEHASADEMRTVFSQAKGRLFLLGICTGLLYFIPLLNLAAPVFAAMAFIHLCLAELSSLREGEKR
jgi:CysZ protein